MLWSFVDDHRPAVSAFAATLAAGKTGRTFRQGDARNGDEWPPARAALRADDEIALAEVAEGRVVFTGRPAFSFLNPMGTVHGGWIATILDSAMACAVHSTLSAGQIYTTTAMTINYVRPLFADSGAVRCEATAIYSGARMATSEGRLLDSRGRLIAHGTEGCMILDNRT